MSERYYITGVQIGIIKALLLKPDLSEINKIMEEIQNKQFVGNITQKGEKVGIIN